MRVLILVKTRIFEIVLRYMKVFPLIAVLILAGTIKGAGSNENVAWDHIVQEAHDYDPAFATSDKAVSREKAIFLYRKAITEYPNNPSNIKLKHRIAQLYAFYSDPRKNIWPNRYLAAKEFKELITQYPITELDCLQSHIGLAGITIAQGNMKEAVQYYRKVLDFSPEGNPELVANFGKEKLNEYSKTVESVRLISVDNIAYASIKVSPQYFFYQMKYIIDKYPDTLFSQKAQEHRDSKAEQMTNLKYVLEDNIKTLALLPEIKHSGAKSDATIINGNANIQKISPANNFGTISDKQKKCQFDTMKKPEESLRAADNMSTVLNAKISQKSLIEQTSDAAFPKMLIAKTLYIAAVIIFLILVIYSFKYRSQLTNKLIGKEKEL